MSQVELATALEDPALDVVVSKPALDLTISLTSLDVSVQKAESISVDPLAVV